MAAKDSDCLGDASFCSGEVACLTFKAIDEDWFTLFFAGDLEALLLGDTDFFLPLPAALAHMSACWAKLEIADLAVAGLHGLCACPSQSSVSLGANEFLN